MEVWWRMHFHHSDLHHRVLGIRLRKLLRGLQDFIFEDLQPLLPTDDQLFRFLPHRKIWSDSTAIKLFRLIK